MSGCAVNHSPKFETFSAISCSTAAMNKPMLDYNSRLKPMHQKGKCGDAEKYDSEEKMHENINQLVELVTNAKYCVIFTGAGISTSAGIPDFRGPTGIWTRELRGEVIKEEEKTAEIFNKAQPSYTHYALAKLMEKGYIHHIISQNVDGLHLRSGIPFQFLSELHGNICLEVCEDCQTSYFHPHDIGGMNLQYTGRCCSRDDCKGRLKDAAIDWDTSLPRGIFSRAHKELQKADLCICLGTSLRIRPAGNMPLQIFSGNKKQNKGGKLVIVNLQRTHLDARSSLRLFGRCDKIMQGLMAGLQLKQQVERERRTGKIRKRIVSKSLLEVVDLTYSVKKKKESEEEEGKVEDRSCVATILFKDNNLNLHNHHDLLLQQHTAATSSSSSCSSSSTISQQSVASTIPSAAKAEEVEEEGIENDFNVILPSRPPVHDLLIIPYAPLYCSTVLSSSSAGGAKKNQEQRDKKEKDSQAVNKVDKRKKQQEEEEEDYVREGVEVSTRTRLNSHHHQQTKKVTNPSKSKAKTTRAEMIEEEEDITAFSSSPDKKRQPQQKRKNHKRYDEIVVNKEDEEEEEGEFYWVDEKQKEEEQGENEVVYIGLQTKRKRYITNYADL